MYLHEMMSLFVLISDLDFSIHFSSILYCSLLRYYSSFHNHLQPSSCTSNHLLPPISFVGNPKRIYFSKKLGFSLDVDRNNNLLLIESKVCQNHWQGVNEGEILIWFTFSFLHIDIGPSSDVNVHRHIRWMEHMLSVQKFILQNHSRHISSRMSLRLIRPMLALT